MENYVYPFETILEVNKAKYIDGYKLLISFNTGEKKIVDLEGKLEGPVFKPLQNIEEFKKFKIDYTIEWASGADIAPEYLYEIGEPI